MISSEALQIVLGFTIFVGIASGKTTTASCSNPNLLMTPVTRQKVLDAVNDVRTKLQNGQLLLSNGKYALKAEKMPLLTWDCGMEETLFAFLNGYCNNTYSNTPHQKYNVSWTFSTPVLALMDTDNVESLVNFMIESQSELTAKSFTFLSLHNIYTATANYQVLAISDKAVRLSCAVQNCNINNMFGKVQNQIMCYIGFDEELTFGDQVYEVSASANYTPPSQDLICQNSGKFTIEEKEILLEKINVVRAKISQRTFELENGNLALQPSQPLTNLTWSCADEEALMFQNMQYPRSGGTTTYNPDTDFQKVVQDSGASYNQEQIKQHYIQSLDETFEANSNLNFLSSSSIYSTQYPAVFALSDQASTIACHAHANLFYFMTCRVKPSLQINDVLYHV